MQHVLEPQDQFVVEGCQGTVNILGECLIIITKAGENKQDALDSHLGISRIHFRSFPSLSK